MKPVLSYVIGIPLATVCLILLWRGLHQHAAASGLAYLAGGTLCVDALAIMRKGGWLGAASVVTILYGVIAEFLLLVIPAIRGGSWLAQTGFVGLSSNWVLVDGIAIVLPLLVALFLWRRS